MRDLTEFEKGKIVGTRMAGASVTKTAELFSFSRSTISRTMAEFKNYGKLSSYRGNFGRTSKLTDRYRRALKRIVGRNHRTTTAEVTTELSLHPNSQILTKNGSP